MSQMRAIVDKLLTNVALGYFPQGMVANKIFPPAKVMQYTGKIGKYGKNHLRIVNTVMGGRGKASQMDARVYSSENYEIESHGLFDIVTKRDYANVEKPFDAESDSVRALQMMLKLSEEKSVADALTNSSVITQNTTLAGADQFSDRENSDPLAIFTEAKKTVIAGCGLAADTIVMDEWVALELSYHPQLFDRLGFKYNRTGPLTYQNLADALGVKRLLVPSVRYNSAKEGQTDALSAVWGKHIIVMVAPEKPEIGQVTAGYRFTLAGQESVQVYKTPVDNPPGSTQVLCDNEYDNVLVDVGAAYLIKDAIA